VSKSKTVIYSAIPSMPSIGRNGPIKTSGVEVGSYSDDGKPYLTLEPKTSRGDTGRAMIVVPLDAVDSLIAAVQEVRR